MRRYLRQSEFLTSPGSAGGNVGAHLPTATVTPLEIRIRRPIFPALHDFACARRDNSAESERTRAIPTTPQAPTDSQNVRDASAAARQKTRLQIDGDRRQPVRSADHPRDFLVRDRTIDLIGHSRATDERAGLGVDASDGGRAGRIFASGHDYIAVPIRQFPPAGVRS